MRTEAELVEANSKLGVIAGLTGFVAVIPAALLQLTPIKGWGDACSTPGALFGVRPGSARPGCPPDVVAARPEQPAERVQLHSIGLQLAAVAMLLLRAAVGFMFFHLAFWLRSQTAGTAWFAVAVGMSALATMAGNAISPDACAGPIREETMLAGALALSAVAGLARRPPRRRRRPASASPSPSTSPPPSAGSASRASSSATRRRPTAVGRSPASRPASSSAWAVAGLIPVLIDIPGRVGFLVVGLMSRRGRRQLRRRHPLCVDARRPLHAGRRRTRAIAVPLPPPRA